MGSGFPLGNGGRYDGLLNVFGSNVGATGFSIRVDRLLETLASQRLNKEETIAVLFEEAYFEQALALVKEYRMAGKCATLQLKESLVDEAAFTAQFTEVVVVEQEEVCCE